MPQNPLSSSKVLAAVNIMSSDELLYSFICHCTQVTMILPLDWIKHKCALNTGTAAPWRTVAVWLLMCSPEASIT